jgi:uncharacterized protein (TIGR03435 family)
MDRFKRWTSVILLIAGLWGAFASAQQPAAPRLTFEVASVKRLPGRPLSINGLPPAPDRYYKPAITASELVQYAYTFRDYLVFGGPNWVREDWFEINAKAPGPVSTGELKQMLQSLLEDRFKLVVHREQREMSFYSLVLADRQGRVGMALERCDNPENPAPLKMPTNPPSAALFAGRCYPSATIAGQASQVLQMPVVDKTGLTGLWTFLVWYAPTQTVAPPGDATAFPSLATALQEELGLKLERGRGPIEVLVIDFVQHPIEN